MMKKKLSTGTIILLITFGILFVAVLFLPSEIPYHFDSQWNPGMYASKYLLLLGTPIPYLIWKKFSRK